MKIKISKKQWEMASKKVTSAQELEEAPEEARPVKSEEVPDDIKKTPSIDEKDFASKFQIAKFRNEVMDRYNRGEITKEQLKMWLEEFSKHKTSFIKLSKSQWEFIGQKAGWIKEAKWGKEVEITNPGKWEGYSLEELKSKRDAAKSRQEKRKKDGKAVDPKDTSILKELNFAIRAKTGWGKAD